MSTESVLALLVELFAKSMAIALFAVLLARTWRGASAAQRHLVGTVALVTITMLPITRLVSPRWAIPIRPGQKATIAMTSSAAAPAEIAETDSVSADGVAPARISAPPDWRKIALGFWLAGAVLLSGHRLIGSWRLQRLKHRSVPLDDTRVRILLSRTLQELGVQRPPEIRLSRECRVPITWGSARPVMLLPVEALDWNDTWLTAALRHEAAHIRRHDYLARWVAQLACAIYWPNPCIWLLARSLRLAQEQAADDLVLRAGTPAEEYATQLVDAARTVAVHGFFVRQAVAMACPSTLEDRVRAIVDGRRDRRPLSRMAAAFGSMILALALGLSTAAQLRSENPPPPPARTPEAPGARASGEKEPQIENHPGESTNGFVTKEWKIPPDMIPSTPGADGGGRETARDWLISKGVNFDGGATAIYVSRRSRLIVRNTPDQLDLVDQIVGGGVEDAAPAKNGQDLPVGAAASPGGTPRAENQTRPPDFLGGDRTAASGTPDGATVYGAEIPALTKARGIIVPKIELREAALAEVVDFLRKKSVELDPDKVGVNLILKPGTVSEVKITLTLNNIPLLEAVRYTAGLANLDLDLDSEADALVLHSRNTGAARGAETSGPNATYSVTTSGTLQAQGQATLKLQSGGTISSTTISELKKPVEPANPKDDKERVDLTADSIRQENGISIAQGSAVLKYGGETMKADQIRYDRATRQVDLTGKVEIKSDTSLLQADRVTLWLTSDGQIKIKGPHKVNVIPSPETQSKGTVEQTNADLRRHDRGMPATPADQNQFSAAEFRAAINNKLKYGETAVPDAKPNPAAPETGPDDLFLEAYLAFRQAEKLKLGGQTKEAMAKLQLATVKLDAVSSLYPDWQPQIVEYRKARVAESIQHLEGQPTATDAAKATLAPAAPAGPAALGLQKNNAEQIGIPVPDHPGYIRSPYAPEAGMIDVRPFPSGTKMSCPYTGKIIVVP